MFYVSEDLLKSIITLRNNDETGMWNIFVNEFSKLASNEASDVLHSVPERDDVNGRMRFDVSRGIAIALDILAHALQDPIKLIEDIEITDVKRLKNEENNPY